MAKPTTPAASLFTDVALEQVLTTLMRMADPDLVLTQLGMSRADLRKLETDDEISAALETRREAVIATPWRLEPYEPEPSRWLGEELAPHIEPLLRGAWGAVPYGYSVQEVIYRRVGARIGIARVVEKPVEWFEPRRDGLLWYTAPNGGLPTPVDTDAKFLLTRRTPTYRNPYGEALLSRCYWPWFFRHNGWRFWMRFLERFAEPLLLGQVFDPAGFVTAMNTMGLEAVVGVGKEETITAVTPAASGEFEKVEMALGRRIQKLILGQTLTSEIGDKGSYAAAQVHNQVRQDKRSADLRLVNDAAQRLVNSLWSLNGFAGVPPTFVLADDTGLEAARAERDAKLVQAGALSLTEQYFLDRYDFAPGDFVIPSAPPVAPAPEIKKRGGQGATPLTAPLLAPGQDDPTTPLANNGQRFTADQELVEAMTTAALSRAASPIPAAAVRSAILSATDPEDLAARLADLYQGQDASAFRELMETSLFAADVLGYATADKRIGV